MKHPLALFAAMVLSAAIAGCSRPPAVEFENLHLISSLRTACSAENTEWLDGVARAVEKRHGDGRMSDIERDHFVKLIDTARSGDWETAETACLQFEKAQLSRRRERPAEEGGHAHDHHH
jgi:hypothetical protein